MSEVAGDVGRPDVGDFLPRASCGVLGIMNIYNVLSKKFVKYESNSKIVMLVIILDRVFIYIKRFST